jgi:hypothetical protein
VGHVLKGLVVATSQFLEGCRLAIAADYQVRSGG